jgi:hypothetical protein
LLFQIGELSPLRYPFEVIGYLALVPKLFAAITGFVGIFDEVTF